MKLKNIGYAALLAATATALLIGSAATGEAKAKKKMEPAAAPPVICVPGNGDKPVCAIKGGMKFTYADACFAAHDGAKVISNKACPGTTEHKIHAKKTKPAKSAKPTKKKEKKKM
ncbi:MAG: hypothetical protein ACREB2_07575 [Pseudolabrys sp.]